jgi:hypothetical protein
VETSSAWAYSETEEKVDAFLQSQISLYWAWRMWWVFDGEEASAAKAGPSGPSSSSGLFAPITLCPVLVQHKKDHGGPGATIGNLSDPSSCLDSLNWYAFVIEVGVPLMAPPRRDWNGAGREVGRVGRVGRWGAGKAGGGQGGGLQAGFRVRVGTVGRTWQGGGRQTGRVGANIGYHSE